MFSNLVAQKLSKPLSSKFNKKYKRNYNFKLPPMKFRFVVAWFISTHLFIAMFWKLGDSQLVPQGTYYLFLWAILVTTPLLICLFFILFWIKTEHSLTWTQSFQTLGYKKPDKKQLL
ncbi:MAG TPA: hypothetical protein VK859_09720, partial [bacterium]|nr:hypothetical protein [bacterium]